MKQKPVLPPAAKSATAPRAGKPAREVLKRRPGFLIRRLHQIHTSLFAEECEAFGITPVQYSLMTALLHHGEADQVSLAAEVGIDRANTTDVLRRLEERGFIGRKMSAEDSRAKLCTLTRDGRRTALAMEKAVRRAHDRTIAVLPAAERKAFVESLRRLVDAYNDLGRTRLRLK
jgi:DNA-binding MarR family transcriptional regulator